MQASMRALKLRNANVLRPVIVAGKNPVRTMFCHYDHERRHVSASDIADAVASIADDGLVLVDMKAVSEESVLQLLTQIAKACFVFRPHPVPTTGNHSRHKPSNSMGKDILFEVAGDQGPQLQKRIECMYMAASIQNVPANVATPEVVAAHLAAWFAKTKGVQATILRQHDIVKEGMQLVNAVGSGASAPPCVLVIRAKRSRAGPTVALLGKGVTYDSGGLSLKPQPAMYGMHGDKSGAAIAAAVFHHAVTHMAELPCGELVAVIPLVENAVSGSSMRPNDVYTAANGTTVEIVDTDAEGRLILADALAYSARFKPHVAIDFATLTETGSLMHPDLAACYFTANEGLHTAIQHAAACTGERCWRMPAWTEDGDRHIVSEVADLRNAGWQVQADGYLAALFMLQFVPRGAAWAHIDVSRNQATDGGPFVGTCVQLGIQLLEDMLTQGIK
jgi:leucyl aminopeptidase